MINITLNPLEITLSDVTPGEAMREAGVAMSITKFLTNPTAGSTVTVPAGPAVSAAVNTPLSADRVCPVHNVPLKLIPAGVSKTTGKAYNAFWACSIKGCRGK